MVPPLTLEQDDLGDLDDVLDQLSRAPDTSAQGPAVAVDVAPAASVDGDRDEFCWYTPAHERARRRAAGEGIGGAPWRRTRKRWRRVLRRSLRRGSDSEAWAAVLGEEGSEPTAETDFQRRQRVDFLAWQHGHLGHIDGRGGR
ncbi:hypothetical protein C8J57DRAFT_1532458 [Mycena rebaudengoi]|nr:hypothetical protein C8J57DRAFT_1532458 [Mycena rebaudengoi]